MMAIHAVVPLATLSFEMWSAVARSASVTLVLFSVQIEGTSAQSFAKGALKLVRAAAQQIAQAEK